MIPNSQVLASLERAIIGGALMHPDALVLLRLDASDFATHARDAFAAMRKLEAASKPIDHLTVEAQAIADGMDPILATMLLAESLSEATYPAAMVEHARIVRDAAVGRRVAASLTEIVDEWKSGAVGGAQMLSMAMGMISHLDVDQPDDTAAIGDVIRERLKQLDAIAQARLEGKPAITGAPTGCTKLDEKVGGWPYSLVSLIAGRPGHGKSSLKIASADACSKLGIGVHDFSLEDSREAYADRSLARESGTSAERLRNAELQRDDMPRITSAVSRLRLRRGWLVDNRSGITADEIVRSVRRHRKQNGTRVAFVDYVQLVKKARGANAHEALTEIINTFADAAKQDGIAYVVLSQLNRELEKRPDKRPQLADLRESGSLEERAKGPVVFVYRGSTYGGEPKRDVDWDCDCGRGLKHCQHTPSQHDWEHQAQLIVGKNSNGRTGRVFARWTPETMRME